jgi:hypothetical protein
MPPGYLHSFFLYPSSIFSIPFSIAATLVSVKMWLGLWLGVKIAHFKRLYISQVVIRHLA